MAKTSTGAAGKRLKITLLRSTIGFNKTQAAPLYTPDLDRPGTRDEHFRSNSVRVTWQATPKNKFSGWVDIQKNRTVFFAPSTAPEALNLFDFSPVALYQTTWSSPVATTSSARRGGRR